MNTRDLQSKSLEEIQTVLQSLELKYNNVFVATFDVKRLNELHHIIKIYKDEVKKRIN